MKFWKLRNRVLGKDVLHLWLEDGQGTDYDLTVELRRLLAKAARQEGGRRFEFTEREYVQVGVTQ